VSFWPNGDVRAGNVTVDFSVVTEFGRRSSSGGPSLYEPRLSYIATRFTKFINIKPLFFLYPLYYTIYNTTYIASKL